MSRDTNPFHRRPGTFRFFSTVAAVAAVAAMLLGLPASGASLASSNWPAFRGPTGDGQVPGVSGLPLHWSETENIKWKTEIPFRGWSTPAVMDGKVWLTTATEDGHDFFVICVDADTGKILRDDKLFHSDNPEPLGNPVNSYATPSPALEPGRVYVHFGSYGTACLDAASGKVLWKRDDLLCCHFRGPSSSPVLFQNLLILTFDGADLQYTVALNKDNGQSVWKTDRSTNWNPNPAPGKNIQAGDMHKAHSTPLLVNNNPDQPMLLSADAMALSAYDPRTGGEIWKARFNDFSAAPSPLFDNGVVFFVTGNRAALWAVKSGGRGDVTDSRVLWKLNSHVGKYSSPILVDGLLYTAAEESFLACVEAASGQIVWNERIGGGYQASPVYADGRLYFLSQQGITTVIKPGRALEILAVNQLADGFMASPAVAGDAFFLRTTTHLYRVQNAGPVRGGLK